MLYGKSPFLHENPNLMYGRILEGEPVFPKEFKYSEDVIDLIKKLLKKNGAERIGYDDEQEIFTHPWFNDIDFAKLIAKKLTAVIIPCVEETTRTRRSLSQRPTEEELEEQALEDELDLSFEHENTPSKQKKPGVNDSLDDFSYFEEEGWVETAIDAQDDENILEEFEDEKRIQMLTNIEEYSELSAADEEEGGKKEKRDALNSPQGELARTVSTEDEKEKIKRKGSIDSQFGEKIKLNTPKDCEKSDKKTLESPANPVLKKADSSDTISDIKKNSGSPSSGLLKKDKDKQLCIDPLVSASPGSQNRSLG